MILRRHLDTLILAGDPKQLPACVLSPSNEDAGFGRSLMERLMYVCDFPYSLKDFPWWRKK